MCLPHPEPSSHLPPTLSLWIVRALALGDLLHELTLHWLSILQMVMYMFQCYSLKRRHRYRLFFFLRKPTKHFLDCEQIKMTETLQKSPKKILFKKFIACSQNYDQKKIYDLNCVCVCVCVCVCAHAQSLIVSMDCSLLGSSVHGIFQSRILEWVATSCSRESSHLRDETHVSCIS